MENQFTDYETSKKLKQLGFNEECFKIYCSSANAGDNKIQLWKCETVFEKELSKNDELTNENSCTAPLWLQAKEWIWKNKNWSLTVRMMGTQYTYEMWNDKSKRFIEYGVLYDSPIEAEIDGIKYTIEYLSDDLKKLL